MLWRTLLRVLSTIAKLLLLPPPPPLLAAAACGGDERTHEKFRSANDGEAFFQQNSEPKLCTKILDHRAAVQP
jgi:hypothetical protein